MHIRELPLYSLWKYYCSFCGFPLLCQHVDSIPQTSSAARGINLGRVFVLFVLGAKLSVKYILKYGTQTVWEFLKQLVKFLLQFLATAGFFTYLRRAGGFVSLVVQMLILCLISDISPYMSLFSSPFSLLFVGWHTCYKQVC